MVLHMYKCIYEHGHILVSPYYRHMEYDLWGGGLN